MEEQKLEERFEAAARHLCDRWGCFDFRQRNPGSLVYWNLDENDLDARVRSLKSDIERLGAVAAVKRRLQPEPDEVSVELAAYNRLDLTLPSLSLRPAWKPLFDETERLIAAERLAGLVFLAFPDQEIPRACEDLDRTVNWLNNQVIRFESDPLLPRERRSWCELVAGSGRAFDETGLIQTSLEHCDHFFVCSECNGAWPQLDEPFRRFVRESIQTCNSVLRVLRVCLERASLEPFRCGAGQDDEVAWRAIVCAAGITYIQSIRDVGSALFDLASGRVFAPNLQNALASLDPEDIYALAVANRAGHVFLELQWFLYDDNELVYLPSDGDLVGVPGFVVVLDSVPINEWKRRMTGSDLVFQRRDRDGSSSHLVIMADGLLAVLHGSAELVAQGWMAALSSTADKIRKRAHELWVERKRFGVSGSPEEDWAQAEREVLVKENRRTPEPEPRLKEGPVSDGPIQSLSAGMTELRDMVESNSAAQIPLIDTVQQLLAKMDGPSRLKAEESLQNALTPDVYAWLCPPARNAAITAEYCWLDPNFPDPSRIVGDLATAFERQLRVSLFEAFCDRLKASGIRNYPERPGNPLPSSNGSSPGSRPGLPLQPLLSKGRMSRLTLDKMGLLLQWPQLQFKEFLEEQQIDTTWLMNILREITIKRNQAIHEGPPWRREDVHDVRLRWLGLTEGSRNIFAAIKPRSALAGRVLDISF